MRFMTSWLRAHERKCKETQVRCKKNQHSSYQLVNYSPSTMKCQLTKVDVGIKDITCLVNGFRQPELEQRKWVCWAEETLIWQEMLSDNFVALLLCLYALVQSVAYFLQFTTLAFYLVDQSLMLWCPSERKTRTNIQWLSVFQHLSQSALRHSEHTTCHPVPRALYPMS